MKVKNEYVQIILGNKAYTKKNMLFNNYINRLFLSQLNPVHDSCEMNRCYIKLDTPIENVDYDTVLNASDFDIKLTKEIGYPSEYKQMFLLDKNYIKLKYNFNTKKGFIYNGTTYYSNQLIFLNGRKITAIAFGYENDDLQEQNAIFSFVDTSNMNIKINMDEQISVSRLDTFESDGICHGFDFPLHLNSDVARWGTATSGSKLYSIGFGNSIGIMSEEYLIDDLETTIDDNSISFDIIRDKKVGVYPNKNQFPGFIPLQDNSKYLIFKYRFYLRYANNSIHYLDKYYTMNKLNNDFGNLNIKLKMERL